MGKIKQLSAHEAQKIAAGEVIERPANIVKELIENSIDAGATLIKLYIEDGGKQLIHVIDNGCGMDADDAQICFNRHATSKISSIDQLDSLKTFGFRGEALASIAAVSKVTLITKPSEEIEGIKIVVIENEIKEKVSIGCATGTEISIASLFYNVPARKKFLKTTQTELRQIQLLFNAFCFDYPYIQFLLFSDDKQILNCPSSQNLQTRCLQLFEKNIHQQLITIAPYSASSLTIEGIISDHQVCRYDRSSIYFFVNNRWVKNSHLTSTLIKGYANVIPAGRYPLGVIKITIDPQEVDINIHPRKEEVKFLHPQRLETALQTCIRQALENNLSKHIKKEIHLAPFPIAKDKIVSPAHSNSFKPFNFDHFFDPLHDSNQPDYSFLQNRKSQNYDQNTAQVEEKWNDEKKLKHPLEPNKEDKQKKILPSIDEININIENISNITEQYNIIGQLNKTYILIEKEEGLFLIDQHAAHERILYELFSKRFDEIATIKLLFPQIITQTPYDIELITPHLDIFHENGISIEQFANDQLIIQSTPVHLKNCSLNDLVSTVLGWINEFQSTDIEEFRKKINEKLRAQMACKAAVKAGDILSHEQMRQLLTDLSKTEKRFSCPHGRPTGWLLPINEIEKKFRR